MIPGLVDIRKVMDQTGGEIFDVTKRGQPEFCLRRADSTN